MQNYYGRRNQQAKDVIVSMTLCEKEEYYDYLKELSSFLNGICFKYLFSKDGKTCSIEVNGIKSDDYPDEKIMLEFDNNLLPSLSFEVKREDFTFVSGVSQEALSEIGTFLGKEEKSGLDLLLGDRDPELFSYDYQKNKDDLKKKKPKAKEKTLEKVANIQVYMMSGLIVKSVNDYFSKMSRNFSYILPLRSIMNRYYRFQNRSVDSIDPDGGNLAMFLNSLSSKKLNEFNDWLNDIFHFKLSIEKSEGHVEMFIEERDKQKRNLVDVGFGFTQILPILTIIWKSVYGVGGPNPIRARVIPITIAIEQPELHLHPRFQSFFAVMLAKVMGYCKKRKTQLRIIIETHSEVIVNKLGQLIYDANEEIDKDDVNVVLFNANKEGLGKYIHSTGFSEDGGLINWPFGFFSEDVY